jgi:hypothetical protein
MNAKTIESVAAAFTSSRICFGFIGDSSGRCFLFRSDSDALDQVFSYDFKVTPKPI